MAVQYTRPEVSRHADLVAQLVSIVEPARVVLGQRASELFDRALDRLAWGVRLEPLHHHVAHPVPVRIADAAVNALVADDRQAAIFNGEVDQNAVALAGPVHAEASEYMVGSRHDVPRASEQESSRHPPLEVYPDLRRGSRLGGLDRARDRVEVRFAEELLCPARMPRHHQSSCAITGPASPSPASARAAPAGAPAAAREATAAAPTAAEATAAAEAAPTPPSVIPAAAGLCPAPSARRVAALVRRFPRETADGQRDEGK